MQPEDIIRLKQESKQQERQHALHNRQQVLLKELNTIIKRVTTTPTPATNNLLSCLIEMAKRG